MCLCEASVCSPSGLHSSHVPRGAIRPVSSVSFAQFPSPGIQAAPGGPLSFLFQVAIQLGYQRAVVAAYVMPRVDNSNWLCHI